MKTLFIVTLISLLSFTAHSLEQLHAYPMSGLQLHATNNVTKVEADGPNVRFFLKNKEIFATAFIFRDTKNPYPLLQAFSEQFLKSAYANNDYQVFQNSEIETSFKNETSHGVEYMLDVDGMKCELLLANAVNNKTYIFINISNEKTTSKCEEYGEKLTSFAKQITESITINVI